MGTISDQELLDLAGENTLEAVKELTLRGKKLTSFEPYASKLPSLQALSLSHNQLSGLSGFCQLHSLVSLNVNSNMLTSLHGLEACASLQQLYAANNKLRDLEPVTQLASLQTLHVFNNAISSLDACIRVLSGLPTLRDIDLGGNPASQVPDYKHIMVVQLPGLEVLDGDTLTQLDREMADEFYHSSCVVGGGAGGSTQVLVLDTDDSTATGANDTHITASSNGTSKPLSGSAEGAATTSRPTSAATAGPGPGSSSAQAPASSMPAPWPLSTMREGAGVLESARPGTAMRPTTALLRPGTAGMARPGTPGGFTSQVCSDELLNDNSLLLEYLARHVLTEGLAAAQQGGGLIPTGSKLRSSFAQRLRSTATAMSTTEGLAPEQLVGSSAIQSVAGGGSNLAAVKEVVATATLQELIRQLVKLAEVLIKEVEAGRTAGSSSRGNSRPGTATSVPPAAGGAQEVRGSRPNSGSSDQPQRGNYGAGVGGAAGVISGVREGTAAVGEGGEAGLLRADVERLRREVKLLQAENANMYWLADEVKRLKVELAEARAAVSSTGGR